MKILLILLLLIMSTYIRGQRYPQCQDLVVENVYIDTPGFMAITLSNSCNTCWTGSFICTYNELQVIKTIAPYDTIATSDCWCFTMPQSNASFTYKLPTSVTVIPPLHQIRVSFLPPSCGCDTIPFSSKLLAAGNTPAGFSVFPNPARNFITLRSPANLAMIAIKDVTGKTVFHQKDVLTGTRINTSRFSSGVYLLLVYDGKQKIVHTVKILKY